VLQELEQPLDHVQADAREALSEVVHGRRHDRAGFAAPERRPDAGRVAHDDVAGKLAQLRGLDDHVAQRADPVFTP